MKALALLAVLAACVDTGPGPAPRVDARYARAHLLEAAPADIDKFDVALGDKAIYLGNKIDRPRLAPGATLMVKHYWKVLRPIGKDWRPFALVRGPQGTADFMNLDATDMQIAYPVEKWKAGDIIEDEQPITIRPDWQSPYAFLYIGLIQVGKHTTLDRMAVNGARTQDRAIVAAKLEIDLSRAPPPLGTIHIPRASGPITIDGMQIDQAWSTAITSPEFVTADGSPDPSGKATAKLTWDDQYLYVFMSIQDTDIGSPYKTKDDSLWKADAIEMFIDADGNRAGYIELQVNPHNTQFDSWFAGPRGSAGDVPWDSGMVSAVKVRGTPDPGDTDVGWDVELGIPWAAVRGRDDKMPVQLPPRIGDRWKLNIVRVDVKSGNDRQSASSWNKIGYGDWHALDKMLTAVFADPTGSPVAPAESPPATPIAPTQQGSGSAAPISPPGPGSGLPPAATTPASTPPPAAGSAAAPISPTSGSATRTPATPATGSGNVRAPTPPATGSGSVRAPTPPATGSGTVRAPTSPATTPSTPATGSGGGKGGGSGGGSGRGPASGSARTPTSPATGSGTARAPATPATPAGSAAPPTRAPSPNDPATIPIAPK